MQQQVSGTLRPAAAGRLFAVVVSRLFAVFLLILSGLTLVDAAQGLEGWLARAWVDVD